ncbi:MAG: hypothetical protein ABIB71_03155 [Candidatus Woesearchaeota archaeon]
MPCKYCNEMDESRLAMSTRFANGRVETIDLCLRCFWLDRFRAGGDGETLREQAIEGISTERTPPASGMD